ncbi:MAG: ChaN family lipoprotein, partial [Deltaproteobacteria bacterium]|nr:ChaN family lipoprotein [Deltaproteobacteria bacterium]
NESVPSRWQVSSPPALRAAIRHARVVLVGDYHTLRQSQRGFLRVLRASRTRNLLIGLEFVMARYQRAVDAYVAGRIPDGVFLRRIEYERSWPSYQVWPNFKPVFEHARGRGARVLALDCDPGQCGSVFSRDTFMAWRLAEAIRERPEDKVFVLVGENHLAPSHLPAELSRALDRIGVRASLLTVHQNIDQVYFGLMDRGLEDRIDVVRLAAGRFVVPVSTPIVAQQSFLEAVTGTGEEPRADSRAAVRREFAKYLRLLGRVLGLPTAGLLEGVTVCGPGDLDEVVAVAERMPPEDWMVVGGLVAEGESVCLPDSGVVYLASVSPTHVAEEAAHFLKARLAGGPVPDDPVDFLYSRTLHEAVGYFGAKVFNPKRKPPSMAVLREAFAAANEAGREEPKPELAFAAQIAAWHRKRLRRRGFDRTTFDSYLRASGLPGGLADLDPDVTRPLVHFMGYELGERLYVAFRDGRIPVGALRRVFLTDFEQPGRAFEVFQALAASVRSIRLPQRF